MQEWVALFQVGTSIGALLVAFIGFGLVIKQIRLLERSIRGSTHGAVYSQQNSINQFFIDHPHFRPYFYSNMEIDHAAKEYDQVLGVTEMLADFFEHVYLQQCNLPHSVWLGWQSYINHVYDNSPIMRAYLAENAPWYEEMVKEVVRKGGGKGVKNKVSGLSDSAEGRNRAPVARRRS